MRWYRHSPSRLVVLLFGFGLIGGAVGSALARRIGPSFKSIDYDWNSPAAREARRDQFLNSLAREDGTSHRVAIVWTAGRSGFSSSIDEMDDETANLVEIIHLAERMAELTERTVAVHLVTSAGGLHEGQRNVDCDTPPKPLRPYGLGKLQQERCLAATRGLNLHVYRPSSVYGYQHGGRLGLISALIRNSLEGRATRIAGTVDTVRDYVFADDIGCFIADRVVESAPAPRRHMLLASGRPAAIGEIVAMVQRVVHVPPLLQYDPAPQNARHMSFRPSSLPEGWRTTSLETGIHLTVDRIQRYQAFVR